ncbi:MAG: leucine-rich repeat domain-containing protein [Saccharofermentanales bacterium]
MNNKKTLLKLCSILSSFCLAFMFSMSLKISDIDAAVADRVLVGASRWDAWVGNTGTYAKIATDNIKILSPEKYRFRTPFFATVTGNNSIDIATTQASMDQEIQYAKNGGIDYWAFQYYPQSSGFHIPLNTYLTSMRRNDVKFCYLLHSLHFPSIKSDMSLIISRMKLANYQTVDGNHPLVYLMHTTWTKDDISVLRAAATSAGLPSLYLVFMDYSGSAAYLMCKELGGQATSAYTKAGTGGITYKSHADTEADFWETYLKSDKDFIPFVTTGWDPRPIGEYIDSLPEAEKAGVRQWYPTPSDSNFYVQTATPAEIANHLKEAIEFVYNNAAAQTPKTVLMYSWCEFTEGGWICPVKDGGTQRLDAIKNMLNNYTPPEKITLTIPAGVTSIDDFKYINMRIVSVTFPDSLKTIGVHAFRDNLLTTLKIPANVISIGDYAFRNNKLVSVTIPGSVTSIGVGAFDNNQADPKKLTIYGKAGSAAQTYAVKNNHTFIATSQSSSTSAKSSSPDPTETPKSSFSASLASSQAQISSSEESSGPVPEITSGSQSDGISSGTISTSASEPQKDANKSTIIIIIVAAIVLISGALGIYFLVSRSPGK